MGNIWKSGLIPHLAAHHSGPDIEVVVEEDHVGPFPLRQIAAIGEAKPVQQRFDTRSNAAAQADKPAGAHWQRRDKIQPLIIAEPRTGYSRRRNRRLADFKRLAGYIVCTEEFPATASLKIKRPLLAQLLRDRDRATAIHTLSE